MKTLYKLNPFIWKYKYKLLLGLFFIVISNYFRILQPQTIRYALDLVVQNLHLYQLYSDFELQKELTDGIGRTLLIFGGLTLLFAFLMGVFMYFMRQTIIVMSHLITYDIRNKMYEKYQSLGLEFYRKHQTGDMMARITEDLGKIRTYLGPGIMYSVNLLCLFVMVIYAMIQVSPTLTLYSLAPLPILSLSMYYVNRIISKKSKRIQEQLSKMNSLAQEVYSGVRVVKSYTQEENIGKVFEAAANEYKERTLSLAQVDAVFRPLTLMLIGTSTIITIYVGGLLSMRGEISPGNIAEFVIYINILVWPVTSIGWVASIIQQAAVSQQRIDEFLDTPNSLTLNFGSAQPPNHPTTQLPNPLTSAPWSVSKAELLSPLPAEIVFENVSFTYPDTGIEALKNINFSIQKGERLVIVGRTGSGKTTIADLLLRMYDPSEGRILVQGVDIKTLSPAEVRQRIGYVPQDVFLFSDSISANIDFTQSSPRPELVKTFASHAAIREEIEQLSEGFDTVIGERGVTLSGGQKQRVSIARALIKDPELIILDDCLSAVDTKTEAAISQTLDEIAVGKTVIIITNRLSQHLKADQILQL